MLKNQSIVMVVVAIISELFVDFIQELIGKGKLEVKI